MQNKVLCQQETALILVTEAVYGSGDFFAGLKWLKSAQINDQLSIWNNSKILWFIAAPESRPDMAENINKYKDTLPNVTIIHLTQWNDLINHDLSAVNAKAIIMFPSVHEMSLLCFEYLKKMNVPILHINGNDETAEMHSLIYKSQVARAHGGFSGLGMFMESNIILTPENDSKSMYLQNLVSQSHSTTFFSYLNKSSGDAINQSTIENFVRNAIPIADNKNSINFITNSEPLELYQKLRHFFYGHKFSDVEIITFDDLGNVDTLKLGCSKVGPQKTLRLINIYPLSNAQMLFAAAHSHPFIQVTGSESLSEILSLSRLGFPKFPFYQTMYWAQHFVEGWIKTATTILGKDSSYVELLNLVSEKNEFDSKKFVSIWKNKSDSILEDSKQFCDAIYSNKNRYHTMLLFIRSYIELSKKFDHLALTSTSRLIEQLVINLQNFDEIVKTASILFDEEIHRDNNDIFQDFATLLRYSLFTVSPTDIITLYNQFKQVAPDNRLEIANSVRDILNELTPEMRKKWLPQIIPALAKIPPSNFDFCSSQAISEAKSHFLPNNDHWIDEIIDSRKNKAIEGTFDYKPHSVLLSTSVLPDGIGDLAKLISVYAQLHSAFPNLTIYIAIRTYQNLPEILEVLRDNSIPISDCIFLNEPLDSIPEHIINNIGLIVSVATPVPDIQAARKKNPVPFLEIAEINFASYSQKKIIATDKKHKLISMGIGNDAVGLDVTPYIQESPKLAYSNLPLDFIEKVFAGSTIKNSSALKDFKSFNENIFFMPCYMKHDHGTFSLKYAVMAANKLDNDKKSIVIWQSMLSYDLSNKNLQHWLSNNGISKVIYYNANGQEEVFSLKGPTLGKSVTIIGGRVSKLIYERLHIISSTNSGLAGAVGQNSFEVTITHNLIPAFYTRSFLTGMLAQVEVLAAKLLGQQSDEYTCLTTYLNFLMQISKFWNTYDALLVIKKDISFWFSDIEKLPPETFLKDLKEMAQAKQWKNMDQFYPALTQHPDVLLEKIFECDFKLLQKAWSVVCDHIKENHNLSNWLINALPQYLPPTVTKEEPNSPSHLDLSYMIRNKYHAEKITAHKLPNLFSYLKHLAEIHLLQHYKGHIDFYITDAPSVCIDTLSGFNQPAIVFQKDWLLDRKATDLAFILTCIAIKIKNSAVELSPRDISPAVIVDNINDSKILSYGLSYIRDVVAYVGDKKGNSVMSDIIKKFSYSTEYWYLGDMKSFNTNLYKLIEIKLAELTKKQIGELHFEEDLSLPQPVHTELNLFDFDGIKAQVIATEKHAEKFLIEHGLHDDHRILDSLEKDLILFKVTSLLEYRYLSNPAKQFLNSLREIKNVDDESIKLRLLKLIDIAYEHKISFFDNLYVTVSGLLSSNEALINTIFEPSLGISEFIKASLSNGSNNELIIMGPFLPLHDLFKQLFEADNYTEALTICNNINNYYKKHKSLFFGEDIQLIQQTLLQDQDFRNTPLSDLPLVSRIGILLPWDIYATWNSSLELRTRFKYWLKNSDPQKTISSLLFRLHFFNNFILNDLPSKQLFDRKLILLSYRYNGFIKKTRDSKIMSFIISKDKNNLKTPKNICEDSVKEFIKNNMLELSLPEFCPNHTRALVRMLHKLHQNSNIGNDGSFIKDFFYNPYCKHGLFEIRKLRKKIASVARTTSEFPPVIKEDPLYLKALVSLPTDVSLVDAILTIHEIFGNEKIPLALIQDKLHTPVIDHNNGIKMVETLLKIEKSLKQNIYGGFAGRLAAKIFAIISKSESFELFSGELYQFVKSAQSFLQFTYVPNFITTLFSNNEANFYRVIDLYDPNQANNYDIHKTAYLYQIFDNCLGFPDIGTRDLCTKILEDILVKASDEDKLTAIEFLLFPVKPIGPLSDYQLILKLIALWSTYKAKVMGIDDNSDLYYQTAIEICDDIIARAPGLYVTLMLEQLLAKILAQAPLSTYVGHSQQPSLYPEANSLAISTSQKENVLIYVAQRFAGDNLDRQMVTFLTDQLTKKSLNIIVDEINLAEAKNKGKNKLNILEIYSMVFGERTQGDPDLLKQILMVSIYHQFWGVSLEERAVIINTLLLPAEKEIQNSTEALYEEAFDYVTEKLLPDNDEDSQIVLAYLRSYLKTASAHTRPFLLTAILSAQHQTGGKSNLAELLPKIAEALGVVGVKMGQVGSDHLPPKYSSGLARLKNQSRLPPRWVLWKMLSDNLPPELYNKIDFLGAILGGASLYIAVEVQFKNATEKRVFRLLRNDAKGEIEYGIQHCKATVEDCDYITMKKYKPDMVQVINDAKVSCMQEIDRYASLKQYKLAETIYNYAETIRIHDQTFDIKMSPIKLYNIGEKYQVIDYADGIEFNDLKKQGNPLNCAVIAYMVVKTLLKRMISGKSFDADCHGAQAKALVQQRGNRTFIKITHYDYGEVRDKARPKQLEHCQRFFNLLCFDLMSRGGNFDVNHAVSLMNDYIRNNSSKKEDLVRLRHIRKGLLSLNDYITALALEPDLMKKLFMDIAKSFVITKFTAPLQFFSGDTNSLARAIPAPSNKIEDCAYSLLEKINTESAAANWVLKSEGKTCNFSVDGVNNTTRGTRTAAAINKIFNETVKLTQNCKDSPLWENALQQTSQLLNAKITSLDYKLFNVRGTDQSSIAIYKKWQERINTYLDQISSRTALWR